MYTNTSSSVKLNNIFTKWFDTTTGVIQGDTLSPTLFNIFLNDLIRDAPFDIWGGGARVFVACKLFFLPPREKSFFWRSTSDNFFIYVSSKKIFVVCFPYYVRYHLVFFLVNIFFINFDNKLFFSAHIFNKLFFSDFCGDKLFISILMSPPPPQISNSASLTDLEQFSGIETDDFSLSVLCYADDIVILCDSEEKLQSMLNHVDEWCSKWCLKVNTNKSKVMHVRPKRLVHTEKAFVLGV